jgi:uncharacterized membrane protein YkgB
MLQQLVELYNRIDARLRALMSRYGITVLRVAVAVVFIWFGALKIAGVSPVGELVARTVYWVSPGWFVPFLGVWELAVGLGLLLNVVMRLTLLLMFAQLAGTFLVLLILPDVAFVRGNPLLLTTEGEFVVKNLVLLAAGIVIGGTVR